MPKRSKAELLGLVERIVHLYEDEKKPILEIEKILRDEGIDISRESIRKTVKTNKKITAEVVKAREEVKALIDTIRDNPATDIHEAAIDFAITKAFEYIKQIDSIDFKDIGEVSDLLNSLTRSKAQIVKLRMDHHAMFDKAKDLIIGELKKAIGENPVLYEQLFTIVKNLEAPHV